MENGTDKPENDARWSPNWVDILLVVGVSVAIAFVVFRFVIGPVVLAPQIDAVFDNIAEELETSD